MNRIYWTDDELRQLARHLLDHDVDPKAYGFVKEVRERYQRVLPKERQRATLTGMRHVAELIEMMDTVRRERKEAAAVAPVPEPVREPAPEPVPAAAPVPPLASEPPPAEPPAESSALQAQPAQPPAPPSLLPAPHPMPLFEQAIDALADQLARRFAHRLKQQLLEALDQVTDPQGTFDMADLLQPAARARKRKILIIGLTAQQRGLINVEFGNKLDLRFVDSDKGAQEVKQRLGDAELVLSMRFRDHAHDSVLPAGLPMKSIRGGLESLRNELRAL